MGILTRSTVRLTDEQRDALIAELVADRDDAARPLTLWEKHERWREVETAAVPLRAAVERLDERLARVDANEAAALKKRSKVVSPIPQRLPNFELARNQIRPELENVKARLALVEAELEVLTDAEVEFRRVVDAAVKAQTPLRKQAAKRGLDAARKALDAAREAVQSETRWERIKSAAEQVAVAEIEHRQSAMWAAQVESEVRAR